MKKLLISFLSTLAFVSCTQDIREDISLPTNNIARKTEVVSSKTIHMFDRYISVLDSACYYKFRDDIWIPKHYVSNSDNVQTRGAAILGRIWKDNKVYYSLDDIPEEYRINITSAILMIEQHSYLDFILTHDRPGCIQFHYKDSEEWDAHSDYLGWRIQGVNIVLSREPIQIKGVIVHEICHAIGMDHEQNRSDRDNYLSIDFNSMPNDNVRYQYTKYTDKRLLGKDIGDFDFESIMLYSSDKYMKKKDGSPFNAQRSRLSKTDMLTLATLQPLGEDFIFYAPLGFNEGINTDYMYQRSKMLRCPEGGKLTFDFQYLNKPNKKNIGVFTYDDYTIKATIKIVDTDDNQTLFSKNFNIEEKDDWTTLPIQEITLPQGFYTVFLTLQGEVKENNSNEKKDILRKLLYAPRLYINLKKAVINGQSKHIPSEFGNDKRFYTFIAL